MLEETFVISISLSDLERRIMEDQVESVEYWINDALDGKINHCTEQLIKRWIHILRDDQIVEDKTVLAETILSHPEYKSRKIIRLEQDMELTEKFKVE